MSYKNKKLAVIGSGIIGLSVAYYAFKKGYDVTIFEKDAIGGLVSYFEVGNTSLEKYYHHFFLSDKNLMKLISELGLNRSIIKKETPMGFYIDKKIYNFSTPFDLLKFKPLSFISRIRMGLMVLYFQMRSKWVDLDKKPAYKWVPRFIGKEAWHKVWKPLFIAKFSHHYKKISVSWLWGRIHPRSKSRTGSKEYLCYFRGGYKKFIDTLIEKLQENKVNFVNKEVSKITTKNSIKVGKKELKFDKIVFTGSPKIMSKLTELDKEYKKKILSIPYQSIVCMTLELKRSLNDNIYWLNISDPTISFSGVIEHTNFISKKVYGRNIAYLLNYLPKEHDIFKMEDEDLFKLYFKDLKKIYPFLKEDDVINYHVSRDIYANPVFSLGYKNKVPSVRTPIDNLYMLNMTQIYPHDRNVDHSVEHARKFVKKML